MCQLWALHVIKRQFFLHLSINDKPVVVYRRQHIRNVFIHGIVCLVFIRLVYINLYA